MPSRQQNVSAMVRRRVAQSLYLRSTFGFGDRTRLRKRTTAETHTLGTRRGTRLRRRDAADKPTFDFVDLYADRQTVKQNQNNIRTTIISRGQNVVTSQLYCTATYQNGRLEKVKLNKANVFLTVDSDWSTKNNGRLETSRELING